MESPSENKENTTRGCLTLNDKIYPTYDGHNTIGRNREAVICINNLNVSKHHAVITVVNEELHFISDFKSSNGTVVDGKRLTPLQLCKLKDGSSIKFGNVFCTYKKLETEKSIQRNVDESQQFSENFYAGATQEVHLPDVPDGISFNEMPTQVFSMKELSINEMPTQVHHFPGLNDESSNDSIDFITMQKSSESQMFKVDTKSNDHVESGEEDEASNKNPTQASSNSSLIQPVNISSKKIVDSETEEEEASQICPVKTGGTNVLQSDSEDTEEYMNTSDQKSKYHISDDSETDIEDNDKNKEDLNETDIVPESEIGEERGDNSMANFRLELSESADCVSDDSFQKKISKKVLPQDHLYCQAFTQTQDDVHRNEEIVSGNEANLNIPEELEENIHSNMQSENTTKIGESNEEKQTLPESSRVEETTTKAAEMEEEKQSLETELKDLSAADKTRAAAAVLDSDSDSTSSLPLPKDEERNEDIFDQPTQQFNFDFINLEKLSDPTVENREQNDVSVKETTGPQAVEILDHDTKENQEEEYADIEETDEILKRPLPNDDINFPTDKHSENTTEIGETNEERQSLPESSKVAETTTKTAEIIEERRSPVTESNDTSLADKTGAAAAVLDNHSDSISSLQLPKDEEGNEDIFDQPTQQFNFDFKNADKETYQILEQPFPKDDTKGNERSDERKNEDTSKREDDIFLQPTQTLEYFGSPDSQSIKNLDTTQTTTKETTQTLDSLPDDNLSKDTALPSTSSFLEQNNEDDLLPPTQAMELLHGDDKIVEMKESLCSKDEIADDSFLPTQTLENILSDPGPSRKSDDVFLPPNPYKDPSPSKKSDHKTPKDDDDSFILPPTQAMEVLHEDGTHFNKVEDELHEIFASQSLLCTQQLVDVLNNSREDDIIDDSIIQEETRRSLSLRKSAPLSEQSVEDILAGDKEDEDTQVLTVNRSTSKAKTYSAKNQEKAVEKGIKEEEAAGSSNMQDLNKKPVSSEDEGKSDGSVASYKRGRRKQNLTVRVEAKEENKDVDDKTVKNTDKKVRKLRGNLIALDDEDEHEGKDKDDQKGKRRSNLDRELSVESNKDGSHDGKRSNTKKKQVDKIEENKEDKGNERNLRSESVGNSRESSQSSIGVEKGKRGKEKLTTNDQKLNEEEDASVQVKDGNRRTRSKMATRNSRESSVESSKDSSQGSTSNVNSRGRRKQKVTEDRNKENKEEKSENIVETKRRDKPEQEQAKTRESSVESSKEDSQKSSSNINIRRGRRLQKVDEAELKNNEANIEETHTEERRVGRPKQTPCESDGNSNSEASEEGSRTRGRRKQIVENMGDKTKSREETPEPSTSKKANKRKQDSDEPPETPSKKKSQAANSKNAKETASVTPRKRALKFPSYDSEDDFVNKVPKIETPTKTRQSARRKKNEDESSEEVIVLSSTCNSEKSVISISSTPSVASVGKPRRLSANSRRQKREEEGEAGEKKQKTARKASVATPVLATPERSRRVLKPKVVFTMMDNPELESLIRTLGGTVVDTVDACTVLVTETVKRSQKLLCAVGQGKPICSPKWLYACKKAYSFLDPWDFILTDKEAEKKWSFSLRESLRRSTESKLLENHTFQLIVNNAADVLKGAIESCGGKCVAKNLAKCTTDHLIIVSAPNNKGKYSKIVQQNKIIKVVEAEAIFDGTLRQEFRFDNFVLT